MFKFKHFIAFITLMFYVAGVGIYTAYEYRSHEEEQLSVIDEKLLSAAQGARMLLEEGYAGVHEKQTQIPQAMFLETARRLSEYAELLGVRYVYDLYEHEGTIVFSATSLTKEEWREQGEKAYANNYLLPYDEATDALKQLFASPQILFEESTDSWGTFRSALIPYTAPDGRLHVIGADMEISSIAKELNKEVLNAVYRAMYHLTLILPFVFFYWWSNRREKERLRQLVNEKTLALERKIVRIREQESLMMTQSRFAAMGEMISMIAHQWRQPVSTMTLMITNYQVKAMLRDTPPDERDQILEQLSETLVYLSDTIDDFQSYFKPEKKSETVNVCDIVERTFQFIEPRIKLHKITLDSACAECGTIVTYRSEVVQVLLNLFNNAIDALTASGKPVRRIRMEVLDHGSTVEIRVGDNGGGIAPEVMPHIFEPYFSTKSKNGTGLGLYMAKMIIEEHIGGTIGVTNTEEGALFSVVLPREAASRMVTPGSDGEND